MGGGGGGPLNLQNLYPQSQSPMSFKQIQSAKRQKRANLLAAAKVGGQNHPNLISSPTAAASGGVNGGNQSRQSNNNSHLTVAPKGNNMVNQQI